VTGSTSNLPGPVVPVEHPAKLVRIGSMVKQLLEEVRAAPLDDAGRERLRQIHHTSVAELQDRLAPELREELDRLARPLGSGPPPSAAELRVAQARLVGWLEGVVHSLRISVLLGPMGPARLGAQHGAAPEPEPEDSFPATPGTYL
jgi:hypothetical protein